MSTRKTESLEKNWDFRIQRWEREREKESREFQIEFIGNITRRFLPDFVSRVKLWPRRDASTALQFLREGIQRQKESQRQTFRTVDLHLMQMFRRYRCVKEFAALRSRISRVHARVENARVLFGILAIRQIDIEWPNETKESQISEFTRVSLHVYISSSRRGKKREASLWQRRDSSNRSHRSPLFYHVEKELIFH